LRITVIVKESVNSDAHLSPKRIEHIKDHSIWR